jgi:hypothetical protein
MGRLGLAAEPVSGRSMSKVEIIYSGSHPSEGRGVQGQRIQG